MKNLILKITYLFGLFIFIGSCTTFETDLYVDNFENPNDTILASDPIALEATAGTLFRGWYMAISDYDGPGMALSTMADVSSCSWGNAGMRDLSSEPREALNNTSAYGNNVTRSFFNSLYSVLSDANTIALAVSEGTEFENPNLVLSTAKFIQALAIGYNALFFDQTWLSDETGSVGEGPADYKAAMDFALGKLDEAIAVAKSNSFSVPESWTTNAMSSTEYAQLMSSYGARMSVMIARNQSDKANINWTRVMNYANNALDHDFEIFHDDVNWYDLVKTYLVYPGWARVDLRIINLMDSSYPAYWPDNTTVLPRAESADARLASDFEYLDGQNFRPERGEYHYSSYRYSRWDEYINEWTVPTVEVSKTEIDMYLAEAKLNTRALGEAAAIINAGSRTLRGQLPPVESSASAIANAIHYERMIEMLLDSPGLTFFEMRKENLLQSGTLLHFPVPGSALEAIPADYYTYGGSEGEAGIDYSTGGWR